MKFFLSFLLVFLATPSQAITWEEFWGPFRYKSRYYPRTTYSVCTREIHREEYVPGNRWSSGYVRRWTEVVEIPCW